MNSCHAHLFKASPFYDLFDGGMAPIKSPLPVQADCIGDGVQDVFFLDADEMTPRQIEAVAGRMAALFGSDIDDVRNELIANGLPIRATQITGVRFPVTLIL